MIKKEFRDSIKQVLVILSVLFVFPILFFFDKMKWKTDADYGSLFTLALGVMVIIIANRLGVEAFKSENEDNSFEYLFTQVA